MWYDTISNFAVILDKCLIKMKLYWNKWNNIENGEKFGMVYMVERTEKIPYFFWQYMQISISNVNFKSIIWVNFYFNFCFDCYCYYSKFNIDTIS